MEKLQLLLLGGSELSNHIWHHNVEAAIVLPLRQLTDLFVNSQPGSSLPLQVQLQTSPKAPQTTGGPRGWFAGTCGKSPAHEKSTPQKAGSTENLPGIGADSGGSHHGR